VLFFTLWSGPCAQAISIIGAESGVQTTYDRFVLGTYPVNPVPNPDFIAAPFDLSGVGWDVGDPARAIAMISEQYFLCSAHFTPGGTLMFLSQSGVLHSYEVETTAFHRLIYDGSAGPKESDLAIGRLKNPISPADEIGFVPILYLGETDIAQPESFEPYLGLSLLNLGHSRYGGGGANITLRLGTNTLDTVSEFSFGGAVTNIGIVFDQDPVTGETLLQSGDSGSPTFGLKDGQFGLLGTHAGVAGNKSVDAFAAYTPYVTQINDWLRPANQSVSLVPEPGSAILVLAALAAVAFRRW